jgi:1-acyl-sn-glycerol-3-phosphate acyltransferase
VPALLRDALVTTWGWTNIAVSTALFGTLAILTSWVPPRGRLYLFWARHWAKSLLWLNGIPARLEISEEAEALPQAVYMSNHESGIDILLLLLAIRQDVRFLAKRELFFVPFMGWSMWLAGFVPVDRRRTDKARDVLSSLDRRLASGISILVFPEGTRSRDGKLGSFKKSGFLTALKSGLPIVPVSVSGARAVLGAQGMVIRRGPVVARVGRPIPTAGLGVHDRAALMDRVRREILSLRG